MATYKSIYKYQAPQALDASPLMKAVAYKQQMYDQNTAKYMELVNNYASLDIIQGKSKEYLSQKLGALVDVVNKAGVMDWANKNTALQINQFVSQVFDENVKAAVSSTAAIRKHMSKMEKMQESGDKSYAVGNDLYSLQGLDQYLNSEELGQYYSPQKYIPYYDLSGEIIKNFKDIKASLTNIHWTGDDQADIQMLMKHETITRPDVRNAIMSIIGTRGLDQLKVNSWYENRHLSDDDIKRKGVEFYNSVKSDYQSVMDSLLDTKKNNKLNTEQRQAVDERVESIKSLIGNYDKQIESINKGDFNRNSLLYNIYKENFLDGWASSLSQDNVTEIKWDDRAFKINEANFNRNMKIQELQLRRDTLDQQWAIHNSNWENDLKLAALKGEIKDNGDGTYSPVGALDSGVAEQDGTEIEEGLTIEKIAANAGEESRSLWNNMYESLVSKFKEEGLNDNQAYIQATTQMGNKILPAIVKGEYTDDLGVSRDMFNKYYQQSQINRVIDASASQLVQDYYKELEALPMDQKDKLSYLSQMKFQGNKVVEGGKGDNVFYKKDLTENQKRATQLAMISSIMASSNYTANTTNEDKEILRRSVSLIRGKMKETAEGKELLASFDSFFKVKYKKPSMIDEFGVKLDDGVVVDNTFSAFDSHKNGGWFSSSTNFLEAVTGDKKTTVGQKVSGVGSIARDKIRKIKTAHEKRANYKNYVISFTDDTKGTRRAYVEKVLGESVSKDEVVKVRKSKNNPDKLQVTYRPTVVDDGVTKKSEELKTVEIEGRYMPKIYNQVRNSPTPLEQGLNEIIPAPRYTTNMASLYRDVNDASSSDYYASFVQNGMKGYEALEALLNAKYSTLIGMRNARENEGELARLTNKRKSIQEDINSIKRDGFKVSVRNTKDGLWELVPETGAGRPLSVAAYGKRGVFRDKASVDDFMRGFNSNPGRATEEWVRDLISTLDPNTEY